MTPSNKTEVVGEHFLPIYLDSLIIDTVIDFDLFIKIGNDLILYRSAYLPFTEKTRTALLENNVRQLYVDDSNRSLYQKYIESNINHIIDDTSIPEVTKAGIVYDSVKLLVRDVLEKPTLGENIRRSQTMVETSVNFILQGREAFHNLVRVMSFDYYTYTHSVNVCTFSVAFALQLGFSDEEFLNNLGVGSLLHDVGKTKISDRILNKRTPLSAMEIELIKKHPQWGVELIQGTNLVHEDAYYPILQHHEREDKSGYPLGFGGDDIHILGKITGISDTFDALTTHRIYQPAMDTFPALKTMLSLNGAFDRSLLDEFIRLLGPAGIS